MAEFLNLRSEPKLAVILMPDDISVKTLNDFVIVEGHHSSNGDDVVRSFERRIQLPKNCIVDHLTSDIGCDGYLIINVPIEEKAAEGVEQEGKFYKVTHALGSFFHLPNWAQSFQLGEETSGVAVSKDKFTVTLEIGNYQPHQICVKTVDDVVIIEGCVEDEGLAGNVGGSRSGSLVKASFVRKYALPLNADRDRVQCEFRQRQDGTHSSLKVIIPRIPTRESEAVKEHNIKVV